MASILRLDRNRPRLVPLAVAALPGVFEESPDAFAWLRDYEPVDKIGYGIFIYRIEP